MNHHDHASTLAGSRVKTWMAAVAISFLLVAAGIAASTAHAAEGDNFGFAEVTDPDTATTAPAFPGQRAFWAGVCDLHAGANAVGVAPPDRKFSNCIEQPGGTGAFRRDVLLPPLPPGVAANMTGPDGWIRFQGDNQIIGGAFSSVTGPAWRLADVTAAGAHPDGSGSFWFGRSPNFKLGVPGVVDFVGGADGAARNVVAELPAGVVGNPNAVPKCPSADMNTIPTTCPSKTQVGTATILVDGKTAVAPVYNVEPRRGRVAELIISGAGVGSGFTANIPVVASVRTDGDFGVDAFATDIPAGLPFVAQTLTIWGVPWAKSHDRFRPVANFCGHPPADLSTDARQTLGMALTGLVGGIQAGAGERVCSHDPQSYDPSWGPVRPFFSTQTECASAPPLTRIVADDWHTGNVASAESVAPLVDGCEEIPFDPSFDLQATSGAADAATGLDVDLSVPQNNDPPVAKRSRADDDDAGGAVAHWKSDAGLATSHLKDSVVTLPEGFSVNPSAATGLAGCSDAGVGVTDGSGSPLVFNDGDPFNRDAGSDGAECPDGSVIGTAEVSTPLLDEKLAGEVVLGVPGSVDPGSGEMLRLFIVLRNRERGLVAKVYGSVVADGTVGEGGTGRLTATFEDNPRVPFDNLKLSFKGGSKGVLATARDCASHGWSSSFGPWSGNDAVPQDGAFMVGSNCGAGFAPPLSAGLDVQRGRGQGTFSFRFSRADGEQYFESLTAVLPQGLLASVKDVPLCANAQASAAACPAGSQIGVVDAKAGAGDPFVLEEKGRVFLTEGYKGGAYGLAVVVRPVAGPFRGDRELSTIVVRQAIHVDHATAQVTAVSDPFPQVWHGVPLRVREVNVIVNRDRFMLNPSSCEPKQVAASIQADRGAAASPTSPFQASGCGELAFKPKLTLALTGKRQVRTGKHPGIKAVVTQQGIPEAGIEKAVVRLPKSLALDVNNAQALCEYTDGTKPDLEDHCPKGSIVGRARAVTPLLNDPLVGNVYFVKNVRVDPRTGNQIRTLPMIVVALRGEISVNLRGESDTTKAGKLVNTFNQVPDAPVSQFNLNIQGGSKGIIAVTRTRRSLINLCATGRQTAEADMDGHNGRRHDTDIAMRKPCTRAQTKAAKRKAKRAAARHHRSG